MDNSAFQKIREIEFPENSPRPLGNIRPRMFRQAMIKDRDNNIYAVYGDRLKKGRVAENALPFDIVEFDGEKGKVWPGSVNGIMPNNIFDNGELAEFTAGPGLTRWKCKCQTDGKQITSVDVVVDGNSPPLAELVPSAIPSEIWFTFALTAQGSVFRAIGPSNPRITFSVAIVTDKEQPPMPGVPGVDRWYVPMIN